MAILKIIGILLEVVFLFNLLIVVHELGHFLAAKWRGLVIEGFGIWFGKPLWQKKIGGVNYSLGSIPAGGFVKLPQLMDSAIEGESEYAGKELPRLKPLDKIIVAFAGPLFSFGLACVFAVLVWQVGRPVSEGERTTTIGAVSPGSPAAAAGLKAGDEILAIDDIKVSRWGGQNEESVTWRIAGSEEPTIRFKVLRNGVETEMDATPKIEPTKWYERRRLRQVGIEPMERPMVAKTEPGSAAQRAGFLPNDVLTQVGGDRIIHDTTIGQWTKAHPGEPIPITVERGEPGSDGIIPTKELTFEPHGFVLGLIFPDSPASRAGLQEGDRIVSVDSKPASFGEGFSDYIAAHNGKPVTLGIERGEKKMKLTRFQKFLGYFRSQEPATKAAVERPVEHKEIAVTPEIPLEGSTNPSIGVVLTRGDGLAFDAHGKLTPSYPRPGEQIFEATSTIFETFKKLSPTSKSSIGIQQLGGPVMMMRIYYLLFESPQGWRLVLWFSVVINVNLALMNMLPIPPLDGSHITLAIVELIRGRPPGVRTQWLVERIQIAGTMLVIGFMLFITVFDVQDIFGGKGPAMRFKPRSTPNSAQHAAPKTVRVA